MYNNGEERIHYRLKSGKQNSLRRNPGSKMSYALAALSASAVTAAAIAVCSSSGKNRKIFGKRYFCKTV